MRHRLFMHIVWTTRDRERLINWDIARFLWRFLSLVARQERAVLIELGVVQTHVHVLMRLNPATSIARLVQRMKGGSAMIANRDHLARRDQPLRWEKGYSIDTVSRRALAEVREYVRDQAKRHPEEALFNPGPPRSPG
jgi:REP element-mobilizing transposase RayT